MKTYQCGAFKLKTHCATIDSGGHHTDHVYNFCKPRQGRRVFAIKGSSQNYAAIASKPVQVGRQRVSLYSIGTDAAKDTILFTWLNTEEPGAGYIHFNSSCDEEYFKQLTAEVRKTEYKQGKKILVWKKRRERNEILDLHVYNYAAYAILNPDIEKLKAKRTPKVEEKPVKPSTLKHKRKLVRPRRNWATDI